MSMNTRVNVEWLLRTILLIKNAKNYGFKQIFRNTQYQFGSVSEERLHHTGKTTEYFLLGRQLRHLYHELLTAFSPTLPFEASTPRQNWEFIQQVRTSRLLPITRNLRLHNPQRPKVPRLVHSVANSPSVQVEEPILSFVTRTSTSSPWRLLLSVSPSCSPNVLRSWNVTLSVLCPILWIPVV